MLVSGYNTVIHQFYTFLSAQQDAFLNNSNIIIPELIILSGGLLPLQHLLGMFLAICA